MSEALIHGKQSRVETDADLGQSAGKGTSYLDIMSNDKVGDKYPNYVIDDKKDRDGSKYPNDPGYVLDKKEPEGHKYPNDSSPYYEKNKVPTLQEKLYDETYPQPGSVKDKPGAEVSMKCGGSADSAVKCYKPPVDKLPSDFYIPKPNYGDVQDKPGSPSDTHRKPEGALQAFADKVNAKDIQSAVERGDLNEVQSRLQSLSQNPEAAGRIIGELGKTLAARGIDVKFKYEIDKNGKPIAQLELSREESPGNKSSGYTTLNISSDGRINAYLKPTGNIITTPTEPLPPKSALARLFR